MTKAKASVVKVSRKNAKVLVGHELDAAKRKEERKRLGVPSASAPDGESSDEEGEDIVFPFLTKGEASAEDRP